MDYKLDREVLETFMDEAAERLDVMEDALGRISLAANADNHELVNEIFRAAHSLKSTANLMDFPEVERLAHMMENILDLLRSGERVPTAPMVEALIEGTQALRDAAAGPLGGLPVDVSPEMRLLAAILASG
ncbi:MAG: Hpt domain-containing protein [Desulfovibrionaceae bacterium]